ncbi:DUF4249 domain-containing protein [Aquimarina sp. I32.4]|uniref:DUF4249 domain-containing protein n=1 Tax=Aquimarina sp. I32.4 TaxID=2053903 RepID=UPI001304C82E|nr:DUF4249 domain-containing protein [Aquimarina sp. I32.4]
MRFQKKHQIRILFLIGLIIYGCVEPFDFEEEVQEQEGVLVVEARLTNELKKHEILLSRSTRLNDNALRKGEAAAIVKIIDDQQNEYIFEEVSLGKYVSTVEFSAVSNRYYKLSITTSDASKYLSNPMTLTAEAQIDKVYLSRTTDDNGVDGTGIFIDGYNPDGTSVFYKYEYEETYKIVARLWGRQEAVIDRDAQGNPVGVSLVTKTREEEVCYVTRESNEIIIKSTNDLSEDRLVGVPLRFIERGHHSATYRYSILAKQYVQSREAYTFYETLKKFSSADSDLFSQIQPGFFEGNIFLENNSNEKVIGFFDVSSVSSKRIYFNYQDVFPDDATSLYVVDCSGENMVYSEGERLYQAIESGDKLYSYNPFSETYEMTRKECGDCTVFGSNIVPDFWED